MVIRNPRIEAALDRSLGRGESADLLGALEQNSGLPGPRPNLELGRAVAARIAAERGRGYRVVHALLAGSEYPAMVGALALGARWGAGVDAPGASERLQKLAEDPRPHIREAVVHAVRVALHARGDRVVDDLASWTDGYLQAHAALEALGERTTLSALHGAGPIFDRFAEAFELTDAAPRAADRSHGVRALRRGLPNQLAALGGRWSEETIEWITQRTAAQRPETREVVQGAIAALKKVLSEAAAARLAQALAATAPPPRDPTRIVQGTRRRGGGRRR